MSLSEKLTLEFFLLGKLLDYKFVLAPGGFVLIKVEDLQDYLKAIFDKIEEHESNNQ